MSAQNVTARQGKWPSGPMLDLLTSPSPPSKTRSVRMHLLGHTVHGKCTVMSEKEN